MTLEEFSRQEEEKLKKLVPSRTLIFQFIWKNYFWKNGKVDTRDKKECDELATALHKFLEEMIK